MSKPLSCCFFWPAAYCKLLLACSMILQASVDMPFASRRCLRQEMPLGGTSLFASVCVIVLGDLSGVSLTVVTIPDPLSTFSQEMESMFGWATEVQLLELLLLIVFELFSVLCPEDKTEGTGTEQYLFVCFSLPEKRNSLSLVGPIESPGFCLDCWSTHLFRWEGIHDAVILVPLVRRKLRSFW